MKILPTPFPEIFVIEPIVHGDNRGFFMESFRADELATVGITESFIQDNHSYSADVNTVRGLNFQWDKPMAKIMRVTRGSAFLVAVDIRKGSPTVGKWYGVIASAENKKQLYAPAYFARGFQTLEPDTEVQYKCTALHNEATTGMIAWNDPTIGITWPISETPVISGKSATAPTLAEWLESPESENVKV